MTFIENEKILLRENERVYQEQGKYDASAR